VTEAQPPTPQSESSQPNPPRRSIWREFALPVLVAVVVTVVVRVFVIQTFWIPSESMENTLLVNDRVLVNKLVYDFRSPRRGEVVVFEAPASWRSDPNESDFIKRVIGVGGDHIVCCDEQQRLVINGRPLDEPYVYRDENGVQDPASLNEFDIVVPEGRLWVMGDHRSRSGDSRQQYLQTQDVVASTIAEEDVIGRAFAIIWPLDRVTWLSIPDTFDDIPDPGESG